MAESTHNVGALGLVSQLEQERRTVSFDVYDFAVRQLIDMIGNGEINISPEYQRQFVWDIKRQSEFIESVFLGIPIPSLFMATNRDATWEVVDGVQRLTTLVHFCGDDKSRKQVHRAESPLNLDGLTKLTEFNGNAFMDLPKSIQLAFYTRPIRLTTLNDKSDMNVRFDLFERLNSGGVSLQPQEIRNCIYRGPFKDRMRDLAANHDFVAVTKLSKADETNGTREEMVLRFFAFLERYQAFEHSVTQFLNDYMEAANHALPRTSVFECFDKTFSFLRSELPKGIIRGNKGSTPVNLFEAISIGTGLLFLSKKKPRTGILPDLLGDPELTKLTSGGTNTRKMVIGRIELVRDRLT